MANALLITAPDEPWLFLRSVGAMSHDPDSSFARRAKIRARDRFIEPISREERCSSSARRCQRQHPATCARGSFFFRSRLVFFVSLIFSHLHHSGMAIFKRFSLLSSLERTVIKRKRDGGRAFFYRDFESSAPVIESARILMNRQKLRFLSLISSFITFFYSTFKIV